MINYETLYNEAKETLSEKRFRHSEGVVNRAIEYAKVYGVDVEIVKLVAMAHDIAKELSEVQEHAYITQYNIQLDEIENISHNLLHAKIGAQICKDKYGFTEDMANAVRYHTTGRANMSLLEKIIYLADATDLNRNYDDMDYYVNTIKDNINIGMREVSKWVINDLLQKNKIIHLDSLRCYNFYANI